MQREPLHSDHSTVRVACALSRSFLNILVLFDSWIIHHNNSSLLIRNNISWMRHVVSIHVFQHPFLTYFFPDHMCHPPNFFPVTGNILKLLPSICTAKDTYFSACPGVASVLKNQTRGSTAESCFMWQWTWVLAMVVVFVCGYIHCFKKNGWCLSKAPWKQWRLILNRAIFEDCFPTEFLYPSSAVASNIRSADLEHGIWLGTMFWTCSGCMEVRTNQHQSWSHTCPWNGQS